MVLTKTEGTQLSVKKMTTWTYQCCMGLLDTEP